MLSAIFVTVMGGLGLLVIAVVIAIFLIMFGIIENPIHKTRCNVEVGL